MNRKVALAALAVLVVSVAVALLLPNGHGSVWAVTVGTNLKGYTPFIAKESTLFGGIDHRTALRIGIVAFGILLATGLLLLARRQPHASRAAVPFIILALAVALAALVPDGGINTSSPKAAYLSMLTYRGGVDHRTELRVAILAVGALLAAGFLYLGRGLRSERPDEPM